MIIVDVSTKLLYEIQPHKSSGENNLTCPVCSSTRKKKTEKCFVWNADKNCGQCHHCNAAFVKHTPLKQTPQKVYAVPEWKNKTDLTDKAVKYFGGRMISQQVLNRMQVYSSQEWMPQFGKEVEVMCFPYLVDGKLRNIKYRGPEKSFKMVKDAELVFYNFDCIKDADQLIICEGEFDALTFIDCGFPSTVSVPNGAGSKDLAYLDNYIEALAHVKVFYIASDFDEAGLILRNELVRRLGAERCKIVTYEGHKDANDLMRALGGNAIRRVIEQAQDVPMEGVEQITSHYDNICTMFSHGLPSGERMGVAEIDSKIRFTTSKLAIWTGIPSHGKALDITTPIPTPSGWKAMRDIHVGDNVFGSDGMPCIVMAETDIMLDRPCYKVAFSDNSTIVCDAEHLWVTRDDKARRSEYQAKKRGNSSLKKRGTNQSHLRTFSSAKTAQEIASTLYVEKGKRVNHSVKVSNPIQCDFMTLPIPPYTLGAWLGDGNSANNGITISDKEIYGRIVSDGYEITKRSQVLAYGIKGIMAKLRALNLLRNKHIPSSYLRIDIASRQELLRGLMDTDGNILKDGNCEFCTIIQGLANDVHELIVGLGMKCQIHESDAKLYGKICSKRYRLFFAPNFNVFNVERKKCRIKASYSSKLKWRGIISCEEVESVPVKCIQVSSASHEYLCGASMIPTHNSELLDLVIVSEAITNDWKTLYFSPENYPIELHYAKIASKITGKAFQDGKMTEEEFDEAYDFIASHMFWLNPYSNTTLEDILTRAEYHVRKYGIKQLVIDPFNCLEHSKKQSENGSEYIGRFLDALSRFARKNDILIHLVAHPAKMEALNAKNRTYGPPTLYDISGSANFYNKADYGITVYRNFEECRTYMIVTKVRFKNFGEVCKDGIELQYNPENGRYQTPPGDILLLDRSNWLHAKTENANGSFAPTGEFDVKNDDCPF